MDAEVCGDNFHLTARTPYWWKLGTPSRCQLEKSSGIALLKQSYPPLRPPKLTTNTQACAASIQVSSGAKAEEINDTSRHKVAHIEVQVTRTDDPMIFLL